MGRSGGLATQEAISLCEQSLIRSHRRQCFGARRWIQRIVGAVVAQERRQADQSELVLAPVLFLFFKSKGNTEPTRKRTAEPLLNPSACGNAIRHERFGIL